MARCRSCNKNLSDRESTRKYANWQEIKNPEDRYIELCDRCISEADMLFVDNPLLDNTAIADDDPMPDSEILIGGYSEE